MKVKGARLPSLRDYAAAAGVDYGLALKYQRTLGMVKMRESQFEKITAAEFDAPGIKLAAPPSIYQFNFRSTQTAANKNDYIMSKLVELQQMTTVSGLAGMHQQNLDNYMANVALAMERDGWSPEQIKKFTEKYQAAKAEDEQNYLRGKKPTFKAWEFAALTGGAAITLRYNAAKVSTGDDKEDAKINAEIEEDISDFTAAIAQYIGD